MRHNRILATLLLAVLPFAYVSAQAIYDIRTIVDLDENGNAHIFQKWDVEVVTGTEWYIPIENLGDMYVHDLTVSEWTTDGNEEFIKLFDSDGRKWDSDRSRESKRYRSGIVDKGRRGVELCWGQGDFGRHIWWIEYYVDGMVQSYDDADGFIYQFVNDQLISRPRHISLFIENCVGEDEVVPFTSEDTKFWGFGFSGTNGLNEEDGIIWFESDRQFESSSWSVIAMCRFEKGRFSPQIIKSGSFEDVIDRAMEGASFGDDVQDDDFDDEFDGIWKWLMAIIAFFAGSGIYRKVATKRGYKYNKKVLGDKKIDTWYRDVPLDGNLAAALWVMNKGARFNKDAYTTNIIGSYFLKWVFAGNLKVMVDEAGKETKNLAIAGEITGENPRETQLWQFVNESAGEDKILQAKEFDRWARKNTTRFQLWVASLDADGKQFLTGKGYLKGDTGTPEGIVEMKHVVELYNFLNDFTLISERGSQEVVLWKYYLIYAQMFGIAEKVTKEFQKLYPKMYEEVSRQIGGNISNTVLWANTLSTRAYTSGSYVASSYSGSSRGGRGGFSSIGGGGGFSGGGHGGGSR